MSQRPLDEPLLPDRKARRQQEEQRRIHFRRAIEAHAERLRLQRELLDYPELIAVNYLLASRATVLR